MTPETSAILERQCDWLAMVCADQQVSFEDACAQLRESLIRELCDRAARPSRSAIARLMGVHRNTLSRHFPADLRKPPKSAARSQTDEAPKRRAAGGAA
jgi:hypothetical protein